METKMDEKDKKILLYVIIVAVILTILVPTKTATITSDLQPITGKWDISKQVKEQDLGQYLVEAEDFDYSHPGIFEIAEDIKSSTATPYDAVKATAKYVYDNIKYSSKVSVQYCYDETASSTLEAGTGDCVSMTRLAVALLRAQGIPARSVGGCLTSTRCSPLFAVYPLIEAQVTPMSEDDFKKRGYLHEWVEFWLPDNNNINGSWKNLEATSGQIYDKDCDMFIFYSYDTNKYDRCIIRDNQFWQTCSIS